jgi:hypothetical protein
MSSDGLHASASAINARCRKAAGQLVRIVAHAAHAARPADGLEAAPLLWSRLLPARRARAPSASLDLVADGEDRVSSVIGSWNTSPISAPRTFCISRLVRAVSRSRPLNMILPTGDRPRPLHQPHDRERRQPTCRMPDSPTRQSVSPA